MSFKVVGQVIEFSEDVVMADDFEAHLTSTTNALRVPKKPCQWPDTFTNVMNLEEAKT